MGINWTIFLEFKSCLWAYTLIILNIIQSSPSNRMKARSASCPTRITSRETDEERLRARARSTITQSDYSAMMWQSFVSSQSIGSCRTSIASPVLPFYWLPNLPVNRSNSEVHLARESSVSQLVRRASSLSEFTGRNVERQSSTFTMSNFPFNHCSYGCPCHNFDQSSTSEDQLSTTESRPPFYFVPQFGYGMSISMPCLAARNIRPDIIRTRSVPELNRPRRPRARMWWIFRALVRDLLHPDDDSVSSDEDWEGWDDVPRRRYDDYDDDRDGNGYRANYWLDTARAA